MIGAGGIGCELLKNLVLAGFGDIEIVDLDTIDLSNLNRQFLFRHEHIKKSKALVAKTVAQRFNANSTVTAHHANIMESRFSVLWFARFAMVFNALDNLEARRHVNRMCLAADVPLIESGTAGFDGQVRVIKKNVTACYDCTDKPVTKSFPVCTIRSTPSQPIHCIVWAKSWLLGEIFGVSEDESAFDNSVAEDNASEIEELKRESTELRRIRENVGSDEFARMLFDKVFDADIQRLRSIEDMWKTRRPPEPLQFDTVMAQTAGDFDCTAEIVRAGQKVWTLEENMVVFMDSLERLRKRMLDMKAQANGGPEPIISFDKDDQDTLDFVAASANIRSVIFGIENKSRFDIKQMAGNIIPAIATTNAIVAGLCVLEAFKVLKGDYMSTKEVRLGPADSANVNVCLSVCDLVCADDGQVFLNPQAKSNRLLCSSRPLRPRVDCPVCSTYNTAMAADLSRATLNDVVQHFLRLELGYGEKDIVVNNDAGLLYDVDETDNLSKRLTDLGVSAGSMLTVIDEDEDDPFVNVVITIDEWYVSLHLTHSLTHSLSFPL